jgi:hypothetical protein
MTPGGLGGAAGAGVGAAAAAAVAPWNDTDIAGPHWATCAKDRVSHSTNLELLLGTHQCAPVAKKKTWMAIQRVRKKRWATTMPRQRAAISRKSAPRTDAAASAVAATPSQNPLSGAGPPGGGEDGGSGGCGTNATAFAPHNCGAS